MPHRPAELPLGAEAYRDLGPFDAASVPKGLLAEHRLKPGTWGRLTVLHGNLDFIWDDGHAPNRRSLGIGDTVMIPPAVPHHLEPSGDFRIALSFYRSSGR